MKEQQLKAFFYLLLRDHLPAGQVESIMVEVRKTAQFPSNSYNNKGLAQYAGELVVEFSNSGEL